jgi:hypothetical protein
MMNRMRVIMGVMAAAAACVLSMASASAQAPAQGWVCTNLLFTAQGPRCFGWTPSPAGLLFPPPLATSSQPAKSAASADTKAKPAANAATGKPNKVIKKKKQRGRR